MLPDINGEEWLDAGRKRRLCVGGFHRLQFAAIKHQPGPATAKLRSGCPGQFFFAGLKAAEISIYFLLERGRRLTPAVGPQALPEKGVIPDLGGIVKNGRLVGLARNRDDNFLQRQVGIFRSSDELVEIIDISLMVFA